MPALELGLQVLEGQPTDRSVSLSPDELVTHGVVFGMTGSGKTGLCLGLLEELALAGIPVLAIDLKGDLTNLKLVFPEQRAEDYRPWLDEQAVRREGRSAEQAATELATARRADLGDLARLRRWSESVEVTVYTPGSDEGTPVCLLGRLEPPGGDNAAARADLVTGTVSGLLGLVGRSSDPLKDPEPILLAQILDAAWTAGESLELATLIARLVDPPFARVGVFPVDTFFPPDQRLALARELNGVLASPAFSAWTRGVALDPARLTEPRGGRTPVSIFYLAHLSDSERMFFLSLLLERVVAWTRSLAGTSSLRALVYLDEVMGYLPPHPANPPSKRPVMTLLKQARSVGVG
ncbi:MAG: helicase HerA-like domain-containing protein, partial [Candidatus Eremiobacterota bacterium]